MKRKLLSMALLAISALGFHANAEDVTSTYLKNADFSLGTPTDGSICTYKKDIGNDGSVISSAQEISNWTNESTGIDTDKDALAGGVFQYGTGYWIAGVNHNVPNAGPNDEAGNAAGLCAVWEQTINYTQDVTLEEGCYTIKFVVFNATNGTSSGKFIATNLFGFVSNEGKTYYASNNTFAIGQWTTVSVSFKLEQETSGKISMGYVSKNAGNADVPHLFVDNVTILKQTDCTDYTSKFGIEDANWVGATDGLQGSGWPTADGRTAKMAANYSDSYVGTKISQTVTDLEPGMYEVEVYAISQQEWGGGGATLNNDAGDAVCVFAEGKYSLQKSWINARRGPGFPTDGPGIYSISGVLVSDGSLTIGISVEKEKQTEWHQIQIKSLTRVGDKDLTALKNVLAEKVAEAQKVVSEIDGHVPAGILNNLKSAIDENDNDDDAFSEEDQFANAVEAISTAIADAKVFVEPYDTYQATKAKVEAIKEQNVWVDKDNAESTYSTAISTADAAVAAAVEVETITTQTNYIIAAIKTLISTVEINSGEYFDLTGLIQNAGLDALTGWEGSTPGLNESCAEFFNMDFDFYQTITEMPAGNYELKVQAFQRPGGYDSGVSADSPINAFIYINSDENSTTIKNVMSEWSDTGYFTEGNGVGPKDYEADGKYYPNGMTGSRRFFDAGYYENTVLTGVGAGDLKFGFKCTNHAANAWTIFDNFRLYYYGTSINVEISEDKTFAAVSDIENANVTLTRTLSKENWNTFAVPFDITEVELTEQFGADVKIATYSETADGENSTVTFSGADELAVAANVPVLIKTPNVEGTEFTFSGKTIKAGSAIAEGKGNFDFVGSYSTITLAVGDYFITDNELREIGEEAVVTLKGTRAYIKAKAGSANIRSFVIGGETVTAIDGIAVEGVEADGAIYNVAGQQVSKEYKGIVIKNGKKYLNK